MNDDFLSKVEKLAAIGRSQDLQFDGVVARIAVDQFCLLARPTSREIDSFAKLMLDAAPNIDAALATRIAVKLSAHAATPEAVLSRLIECGAGAAAEIFAHAPHLSTALTLKRAEIGDCAEAIAIASRRDLDRPVIAALARRAETEPLRVLAANETAHLEPGALLALVQRGRFDAPLARALLRRTELGLGALPLFLWADPETRRRLMVEAQRADLANPVPAPSPLEATRKAALSAANAANRNGFATSIALGLRTGRATVERMIDDASGEPLALVFAAMATAPAMSADAIAMLLPARSASLAPNVEAALQTKPSVAWRIIAAAANGRAMTQRPAGEYSVPMQSASSGATSRAPIRQQFPIGQFSRG